MPKTDRRQVLTVRFQMAIDRQRAGRRLAELREAKHLTQEKLAEKTGISHRQIVRYEGGHSWPRWARLDALAKVLGDEVYEIVPEAARETPDVLADMDGNQFARIEADLAELKRKLDELPALVVAASAAAEAEAVARSEPKGRRRTAKRKGA